MRPVSCVVMTSTCHEILHGLVDFVGIFRFLACPSFDDINLKINQINCSMPGKTNTPRFGCSRETNLSTASGSEWIIFCESNHIDGNEFIVLW